MRAATASMSILGQRVKKFRVMLVEYTVENHRSLKHEYDTPRIIPRSSRTYLKCGRLQDIKLLPGDTHLKQQRHTTDSSGGKVAMPQILKHHNLQIKCSMDRTLSTLADPY